MFTDPGRKIRVAQYYCFQSYFLRFGRKVLRFLVLLDLFPVQKHTASGSRSTSWWTFVSPIGVCPSNCGQLIILCYNRLIDNTFFL